MVEVDPGAIAGNDETTKDDSTMISLRDTACGIPQAVRKGECLQ